MKAAIRHEYGSPDRVEIGEVQKPTARDHEVLIEVCAVSLNASDCESLAGTPVYTRMWGLFRPKFKTLGSDIAGRVEAVGKNVERLKPGDEVFGDIMGRFGGFAEYVCVPEDALTLKSPSLSFEEAAALPQAALVALQGLRDKGKVRAGQMVLINGAGGGSGTFAIQIAKLSGANVTGVDSGPKLDMMRSIGADHVVDYTREDFTKSGERYDLILDLVARRSILDLKRALSRNGVYVLAGGSMGQIFQTLILGSLISMTGSKKMGVLAVHQNRREDLIYIGNLIETGKIRVIIDKQYPLGEVKEALRYLADGHALGKVVITM